MKDQNQQETFKTEWLADLCNAIADYGNTTVEWQTFWKKIGVLTSSHHLNTKPVSIALIDSIMQSAYKVLPWHKAEVTHEFSLGIASILRNSNHPMHYDYMQELSACIQPSPQSTELQGSPA